MTATVATAAICGLAAAIALFLGIRELSLTIRGEETLVPVMWTLLGIPVLPLFLTIAAVSSAVNEHYRCPRCNAIPSDSDVGIGAGTVEMDTSIVLDPEVCAKCGARLR